MSGNIENRLEERPEAELRRAKCFHEILAQAVGRNRVKPHAELFRELKPILAEHGIVLSRPTFVMALNIWLKDRRPESLVRKSPRNRRQPGACPDCRLPEDRQAELRRARAFHELLHASIPPGKHVNKLELYRSIAPAMAAHGIEMTARNFLRLVSKWRKDPRPETLTRTHPVRHRSAAAENIRHVRTYAIRNGLTLRAAWTSFKAARVAGCPSFSVVLKNTPDAVAVDQFAAFVRSSEAALKEFHARVRALDIWIKNAVESQVAAMRGILLSQGK